MRTLKSIFTIATLLVIVFSLSASAQQPAAPKAPEPKADIKGKVFASVDEAPEFPGGISKFGEYLGKNIRYPLNDFKAGTQGNVFVSFVIEQDGRLSDIVAVRGPSETLKAEAIRVMELSPVWKPGMQDGKAVRVQYTVPIKFALGSKL